MEWVNKPVNLDAVLSGSTPENYANICQIKVTNDKWQVT